MNRSLIIFFMSCLGLTISARSPFRNPDPQAPRVTIRWLGDSKSMTVSDHHFRQHPLFTFGTQDIIGNLVPEHIPYLDNPEKTISRATIDELIDKAILEIKRKKRKLKRIREMDDFLILQDKNFSYRRQCGLIVLKFKNYPFVLKLFMERPQTFLNPYIKGMEPIFFHYMAGGVNRHVSGLTRVKNMELVKEYIHDKSPWNKIIKFPRKWYWLPETNTEIEIVGTNFIEDATIRQTFPGIYAIVADAVDTEHQIDMPLIERKQIVMEFSNNLFTYLDPHFNNFIFHEDPTHKNPYTITIVDTEHFPTIVGLEETKRFGSHHAWYVHLAKKCGCDMYFKTKRDLLDLRTMKSPLCLDEPLLALRKSH